MIAALAWRNLWRQPRRTILSALAIAFICVFLIFMPSLQSGSYNMMIESTLRLFDGYAQIQQSDYRDNPKITSSIKNYASLKKQIEQIPQVTTIGARAISYAILASDKRSFAAQVVGVEAEAEKKLSTLAGNIKQGRYLNKNSDNEVVMGEVLARNLQLKLGDSLTLLGMGKNGSLAADSLRLVGIFASGIQAMDRAVIEMPLHRFQQSFHMENEVHSIVMGGQNIHLFKPALKDIEKISAQQQLKTLDWTQLQPGLLKAIYLDMSSAALIYIVMIIVVSFSLLNSLLMSVLERTREFGMLLSLGMRPSSIIKMVWIETLLLTLLGLLMGILMGYGITAYYAQAGIHFPQAEEVMAQFGLPSTIYPELNLLTLFVGPLVIGLCILLVGLFPLIKIHRLQPVTAMRSI